LGCFNWFEKGPCHVREKETKEEKKAASAELKIWNDANEARLKDEWELENGIRRLNIERNLPGPKPTWKFTSKTGKLTRRKGRGGIDWFRYGKHILKAKLFPFQKHCEDKYGRPFIVQEDNAAPHAHHYQATLYNIHDVVRLLWPSNSPDLNMIEPAWPHLKRVTTCRGAPRKSKTMKSKWIKAWDCLDMDRIRKWIERIPRHIEEVIRLEGSNEYKEGRTGQETRSWKGMRVKGQLSRCVDLEGLPVEDDEGEEWHLEDSEEEASEEWEDMSGWLDRLGDHDEETDEEGDNEPAPFEQSSACQPPVNPLHTPRRPHRGRRLTSFTSDERGCPRTALRPEHQRNTVMPATSRNRVTKQPPKRRARKDDKEVIMEVDAYTPKPLDTEFQALQH